MLMARSRDGIAVKATGARALEVEVDALALPVLEEEVRGGGSGWVKELDAALGGAVLPAARPEGFAGGARPPARGVPELDEAGVPGAARALAEGALLGAYAFERYKTDKDRAPGLSLLHLAVPAAAERSKELRQGLELAGEI